MIRTPFGRLATTAAVSAALLSASLVAPPTAAAETAPGTVTDSRPLAAELAPAGAAESIFLRYSTLRTAVATGESTGVVFVPEGDTPDGGWPVVSYAHGTTGIADECAPSTTGVTIFERPAVEQFLAAGYAVVATDYAGMGTPGVHAYLDGPAAGANAADIVRAAHSILGDTLSDRWMVTGLSQGGNTAYYTAAVASERLPELDFRGAVPIAAPTQLDTVFALAGPGIPAVVPSGLTGYVTYLLAGLDDQRPELNVRDYLNPAGIDAITAAKTLCGSDFRQYREDTDLQLGAMFTRPLNDPQMRAVLAQMQDVPASGYDRPLLVTQSFADQAVPAPLAAVHAAEMTASGTEYDLVTFPTPDHIGTLEASMPAALEFAATVLR